MDYRGLLLIFYLALAPAYARALKSDSGFLDFNVYPYLSEVEADSVYTLNIAASLSERWSYFSLTNFIGGQESEDSASFYSEHNIRRKLHLESQFDLTWQSNMRSGDENDRHRIGLRWRLNDNATLKNFMQSINLSYAINLHAYQFDDSDANVWQLEHSFFLRMPSFSEKLYLAGFIDHTFNEDLPDGFPDDPIVAEAQLGYALSENVFVVIEQRFNQYRRSKIHNTAAGLQYKVAW